MANRPEEQHGCVSAISTWSVRTHTGIRKIHAVRHHESVHVKSCLLSATFWKCRCDESAKRTLHAPHQADWSKKSEILEVLSGKLLSTVRELRDEVTNPAVKDQVVGNRTYLLYYRQHQTLDVVATHPVNV